MLAAEIRGKRIAEVQHSEDYLTSVVFSHLRYLPPSVFWPALLKKARDVTANEGNLHDALPADAFEHKSTLRVAFWPSTKTAGEPDLILTLGKYFKIVVEVKYHASESGNQLCRYMRELVIPDENAYLVYLTPRETLQELNDTIARCPHLDNHRRKIFRLQWQDVQDVAEKNLAVQGELNRTILSDISIFLEGRNLKHFNGMQELSKLECFAVEKGAWV